MKRIVRLFDFFFVLRPTLFFPVWTVFAAGYLANHPAELNLFNGAAGQDGHVGTAVSPLLVACLLTLLMGGVFVLNQLHDVATDRQNKKLFLIAHGHISPLAAKVEAVLLVVIGVGAASVLGVEWGILFLGILILTGVLYNCRPFTWKDRPWLGLVANAAGALLIFIAGWWAGEIALRKTLRVVVHATPYMAAVSAVYLYTTLLDADGDRLTGKVTFGVKYGNKITTIAGAVLETLSLALAWWLQDRVMLYPALLSAPFFVLAAIRQQEGDIHRAIKLPILFLAIAVCFEVFEYFLLLVFVYFFSKWYYRYRFGIVYPSFANKMQRG